MTKAELKITIETLRFVGKGEPEWLAAQLDKVLKTAEALAAAREETTLEAGSLGGAPAAGTEGLATRLGRAALDGTRLGAAAQWLALRNKRG